MAVKVSQMELGDALLYRYRPTNIVGRLIDFFTLGGPYSHVSVYIGNGKVIEAHMDKGVARAELRPEDLELIDIYRLPGGLGRLEKARLVSWFYTKLGAKYDLAAFPSSFFKSTLASIFGWRNFSRQRPRLNDPNTFYCSELYSTGVWEVLGINVVPGIHPMSHTPSDLSRGILRRVN